MNENEQQTPPSEPTPGPESFTSLQDYLSMREGAADADDVVTEAAGEAPAGDAPANEPDQKTEAAADAEGDDDGVDPEVSEAARKLNGQKLTRRQKRQAKIQAEIDAATARREAAAREAAELEARVAARRAELAQLEGQPRPQTPPAAQPQPVTPPAPAPLTAPEREPEWPAGLQTADKDPFPTADLIGKDGSGIETFDDLTAAQAKWAAREGQRQAAVMLIQNRQRTDAATRATAAQAAFETRVQAAEQKYPDFRAKVFDQAVPITPVMADLIREDSERGLDVAYHLATNREEAARIATLPPAKQAVEFGRIVATLPKSSPSSQKTGPTRSAPPVSKAPTPTTPVGGAPTASVVPPEARSLSDYLRERNEAEDRRRR